MRNLLKETINIITENNKHLLEVRFVTDGNRSITWSEFTEQANFKYDSGFGGEEINTKLMVVASDWWLERHEYDGSEWWEFKQLPVRPPSGNIRIKSKYMY